MGEWEWAFATTRLQVLCGASYSLRSTVFIYSTRHNILMDSRVLFITYIWRWRAVKLDLGVGLLEYSSDMKSTQCVAHVLFYRVVPRLSYPIVIRSRVYDVRRLQLLISTLPFCLTNGFRFSLHRCTHFLRRFRFWSRRCVYQNLFLNERQCTGTHDTIYPQPHILIPNAMESFPDDAFAVAFFRLGRSHEMEIQLLLSSVHRICSPGLARASVCECVALFY